MGQIKKSIPTWMYPSCPLRKSQLCKPALERINILPECTVKIRTQTDTFKRAVSCFRKAKYWENKLLKIFLWYQLKILTQNIPLTPTHRCTDDSMAHTNKNPAINGRMVKMFRQLSIGKKVMMTISVDDNPSNRQLDIWKFALLR